VCVCVCVRALVRLCCGGGGGGGGGGSHDHVIRFLFCTQSKQSYNLVISIQRLLTRQLPSHAHSSEPAKHRSTTEVKTLQGAHARTHTHTRTHTHARAHTHTHTFIIAASAKNSSLDVSVSSCKALTATCTRFFPGTMPSATPIETTPNWPWPTSFNSLRLLGEIVEWIHQHMHSCDKYKRHPRLISSKGETRQEDESTNWS
jgi:hypothetical protein